MLAWDDSDADSGAFDAVVIRSTWNYPLFAEEFEAWIRRTATQTRLLNPADVCLGNIDKRYLRTIAQRGIRIVSTHWLEASDLDWLRRMVRYKFVLKPTVGAGSMDARVFEADEKDGAIAWLESLPPNRIMMVQPYLESVETVGEQSIVVIGKEPAHLITKRPRLHDDDESVEGPFPVPNDLAVLASKVLEPYGDELLYARVDVMQNDDGQWLLSELELLEPSLFFKQNPGALKPFVDRIEKLVSRPQTELATSEQIASQ